MEKKRQGQSILNMCLYKCTFVPNLQQHTCWLCVSYTAPSLHQMDTPRSDECLALLPPGLPLNEDRGRPHSVRKGKRTRKYKKAKGTTQRKVKRCMTRPSEHWCVCVPVTCWDRTSVKSGLKLPPSNTSHPSVAMRAAMTGALPPTAHRFPGRSREASTSSLNRLSFSIKRLEGRGRQKPVQEDNSNQL